MGPTSSLPQSGALFRPRLDEQLNMKHPLTADLSDAENGIVQDGLLSLWRFACWRAMSASPRISAWRATGTPSGMVVGM